MPSRLAEITNLVPHFPSREGFGLVANLVPESRSWVGRLVPLGLAMS